MINQSNVFLKDQGALNGDGLTPRRPPPLHSSTINHHQRHLSTTQTTEQQFDDLPEGTSTSALLLRLQRRLKQLEYENKTINEELDKGSNTKKTSSTWHLVSIRNGQIKNRSKNITRTCSQRRRTNS